MLRLERASFDYLLLIVIFFHHIKPTCWARNRFCWQSNVSWASLIRSNHACIDSLIQKKCCLFQLANTFRIGQLKVVYANTAQEPSTPPEKKNALACKTIGSSKSTLCFVKLAVNISSVEICSTTRFKSIVTDCNCLILLINLAEVS